MLRHTILHKITILRRNILALLAAPFVLMSCNIFTPPDTPPRALTGTETQVAETNIDFAIELLKQNTRLEANDNSFISPFSYMQALAMTSNGASGTTRDAMLRALQAGSLSQTDLNQTLKTLNDNLLTLDQKVELRIANGIWYNQQYSVEQPFLTTVRNEFGAEVRGMNFERDAVKNDINAWVESKTNNRIKNLIQKDFTANDLMCLVNAIYFNAEWKTKFDASLTVDDRFHTESGSTLPVRMMKQQKAIDVRISSLPGATVAEFPYSNGQFTMTVILPDTAKTLASIISTLTPSAWKEAVAGLQNRKLIVEMPKFTVETRYEERQSTPRELHALGMGIAFTSNADFSGMIQPPNKAYISFVIHKTFLQVDERGTEAAAATAVGIGLTSISPDATTIRLDRPFAFMIREKSTGLILFAGTLYKPQI